MSRTSLIIVGAGAAGLLAARILSPRLDITLIESRDRIGGRVHSIEEHGQVIEAGASFVHGNPPLTFAILNEAGLTATPVSGNMYRNENGKLLQQAGFIDGWENLMRKMGQVKEDCTLADFLEQYFEKDPLFVNQVKQYAEGFDLADPEKVSVQSLYKEWTNTSEDNYFVYRGQMELMTHLHRHAVLDGCKTVLNTTIRQVNWSKGKVQVSGNNGENYYADKILVTVPLFLIGKPDEEAGICFDPALGQIEEAASQIGYGSAIKIFARFRSHLWPADAGFIFSDEKYFPTWWSQLPDNMPVLTGWNGGRSCEELTRLGAIGTLEQAKISLSRILGKTLNDLEEELEDFRLIDWGADPFARGAYSYSCVGSGKAKEVLNAPIDETIYFAGEALYSGIHPGTVEAALSSAKQVASMIIGDSDH